MGDGLPFPREQKIICEINRIGDFICKMRKNRHYRKLKERAAALMTDVPAVFLALKHRKTPWYAKMAAAVVVLYALSPIDLIPDFIPVLGYLDDLVILPALIALTVKWIPAGVFAECRENAAGMWDGGKPKKWYYALGFVLIWLGLIALILCAILL